LITFHSPDFKSFGRKVAARMGRPTLAGTLISP
jgi:hypothetical protein